MMDDAYYTEVIKKNQRQPPPLELLQALGDPYINWKVEKGPFGMSTLSYDHIDGSSDKPSVKGWLKILKQVKLMHNLGYIHGDLLPRNALFNGDNGYLIDFDLSRKEGENYVAAYNSRDFRCCRHDDAQRNEPMKKDHDLFALIHMTRYFFRLQGGYDRIIHTLKLDALINLFENEDGTVISVKDTTFNETKATRSL